MNSLLAVFGTRLAEDERCIRIGVANVPVGLIIFNFDSVVGTRSLSSATNASLAASSGGSLARSDGQRTDTFQLTKLAIIVLCVGNMLVF